MIKVGLIPDGNRRYMKSKGENFNRFRDYMSTNKFKQLSSMLINSDKYSVDELTIYILSEDNILKRSPDEVNVIYNLLIECLNEYLTNDDVDYVLNIISTNTHIIRSDVLAKIIQVNNKSRQVTADKVLNFLVSFNGRKIDKYSLHDMDILIRTGFEKRISNFCPLQIANAELFFIDKYFPDFTIDDFENILHEFNLRDRRHGK